MKIDKEHPLYNELKNIIVFNSTQDDSVVEVGGELVGYTDIIIFVATIVIKLLIENCSMKADKFNKPNAIYRFILWRYTKKASLSDQSIRNLGKSELENIQYDVYELLLKRAEQGFTQSMLENKVKRIKDYDSRTNR